jgi:Ankyrin repeat
VFERMMPKRMSAAEGLHVQVAAGIGPDSSNDARRQKNYWENPRDHARRKVRKEIWERVHGVGSSTDTRGEEEAEAQPHVDRAERHTIGQMHGEAASLPCSDKAPAFSAPEPPTREEVASVLVRIVKDDCSFFSLATLHRLRDLLETPVDVSFLYENDASVPIDAMDADGPRTQDGGGNDEQQRPAPAAPARPVAGERLRSMLGFGGYREFCQRLRHVQTFTFFEYAAWVGRYRVVGAFLQGGINPCVRGRTRGGPSRGDDANGDDNNNHRSDAHALADLRRLGRDVVVPTLFGGVPLALSTYLVKRAVELRWSSFTAPLCASTSNNHSTHPGSFPCALCPDRGDLPASVMLQFDSPHCSHCFCEPCFWKELVTNLTDRPHRHDVVACPICGVDACSKEDGIGNQSTSPFERRQQSLQTFRSLPTNAAELKIFTACNKKRNKQLRPAVASTWSDAVRPLSGRSQEVRRDRLWRYVADPHGTHHHRVRGCLEAGVDVLETNQYGQTPLFVAAHVGNVRVVDMLLEYHSPQDVQATCVAHGGVTLLGAARANGHDAVVRTLLEFLETDSAHDAWDGEGSFSHPDVALVRLRHDVDASPSCVPTFTVLIGPEADHAGAGSYLIDDCLSARSLEILKALWAALPEAADTKKKDVPCSTRRYFCDAEGHIQDALVAAMKSCFGADDDFQVFPHMRFLCYSEPNTALASHLDLPRTDLRSGLRSTHTLLLYLTDCDEGGATCLLGSLNESDRTVLARVRPRRARLFLFPHECPHEGEAVVDVPKLLLRGEARLPKNFRYQ